MAAKRRARRPRSDDSKELGRNGGYEGSDEEVEESGKSGETAMSAEPKEMRLKQAEQPSPPSTKDAGAQGSGEASPARSAPRGGVALKTSTTSKLAKTPPPASQEEDEAGDSGDASPARDPLPDDTADAGHNKRAVTPKRGPPPQQGEERPETVAASALQQLRKALTKPTSPPSSSDIAQEDEHHGREMAEQEQSNTSPSQDEHRARKELQQEKKITEQDHAGDTSPPHDKDKDKDMHKPRSAGDTSPPHDKDKDMHKPRSSETEKKPAVERSWSYDDELKILNALVVHAQSHNGALPDSSHLLANLTFDKIDATEDKLTDKIRKLRRRYCRFLLQGCPSDDLSRRLFKLSEILWGQADEDERVEPTCRDFSVLSKLYPHLAKEVKAYAETHSSGDLIMAMFMTIGDEKARDLDAKCKKQHIEAFKLELGQASLTNELLSALSSLTTKITDPSQATPCKRRAEKLEEPLDEQYLRRSKRVAGKTEGFKDKPNADDVFNPKPLAMVPTLNSPAPHLTKDIGDGIATAFLQIHPRDVWRTDQAGHR
uniref:Putative tyrosine-specific protein phosphatase-like protein n=1 Tax=Saccharum officinarum TaxID=4547 RepID=A0A0K0L9T9_SACOF|nr:putative tyrosine-specific protein phosphatase-like protein [Saccharum officinarum]